MRRKTAKPASTAPAKPKLPSEDDICKEFTNMVNAYVQVGLLQEYDVFHVNNGEHSGGRIARAIAGARARAMGQRKGVADYILFGKHYMEIKTQTGRQSDDQKAFEKWCAKRGLTYRLCRTAQEAMDYVLQLERGI